MLVRRSNCASRESDNDGMARCRTRAKNLLVSSSIILRVKDNVVLIMVKRNASVYAEARNTARAANRRDHV